MCKPVLILLQVGIALVGTSSLLGGEGSATHEISPQKMLLGMGLIIASQVGSGTFIHTHTQTFIHTHTQVAFCTLT